MFSSAHVIKLTDELYVTDFKYSSRATIYDFVYVNEI